MIENDPIRGASKGPKKRDPACLQVQEDIVIPKGTILRQEPGKPNVFNCPVGLIGTLSVKLEPSDPIRTLYKRVIAP